MLTSPVMLVLCLYSMVSTQSRVKERWESPELKTAFKFLLPKHDPRTYQLQDKQMIKVLARVYGGV